MPKTPNRKCMFCGRWWRSVQAFRGHLKGCKEWKAAKADPNYRPTIKVPVFMCRGCWQKPPVPWDEIEEADEVCECGDEGNWVRVGYRSQRRIAEERAANDGSD